MKLAVSFLAILSAAGLAQQLTIPAYRSGDVTVPPILLTKVEPSYTEEALIARLQGAVRLALVIAEDGTPHDVRVVRPLGLGLDENAVEAVAGWRFKAAIRDGRPVSVPTEIDCAFVLPQEVHQWSLNGAQFNVPDNASQPSILAAPFPKRSARAQNVTARVSFDISPQGTPVNIQVERSSDPAVDQEVIDLIREWRFLAALRNGTAIQTHATFDLGAGLSSSEPAVRYPGPPAKKKYQQ